MLFVLFKSFLLYTLLETSRTKENQKPSSLREQIAPLNHLVKILIGRDDRLSVCCVVIVLVKYYWFCWQELIVGFLCLRGIEI